MELVRFLLSCHSLRAVSLEDVFSTALLKCLSVGWKESVVRPGNSQMKEVSEMLTAVDLGSEDLTQDPSRYLFF